MTTSDPLKVGLLHWTCEALGLEVGDFRDELALAHRIRDGLPVGVIERLIEHGIPEPDIFRWIIPRRTWKRRQRESKTLTADESDRAERLARVLALATIVLADVEHAVQWLASPRERFDQQRPLDLLSSTIGTRLVEEALFQAYYGNVA